MNKEKDKYPYSWVLEKKKTTLWKIAKDYKQVTKREM